jgi:hypothetical protein
VVRRRARDEWFADHCTFIVSKQYRTFDRRRQWWQIDNGEYGLSPVAVHALFVVRPGSHYLIAQCIGHRARACLSFGIGVLQANESILARS